ncbi:MAG: hypothetical protein OEV78_04555 [Spirochaetia bacterium]|nr:hypothetical protein [Spirochaetia bacterium]
MPARRKLDEKDAIDHLKKIYQLFLKGGGEPTRFTIRHYNKLNENSRMYIDVYVKKLGGWNVSLQKAAIPLGFRQYKEFSKEEIAAYIKKVYKKYLTESKGKGKYKNQDKTFRMKDFTIYNPKVDNMFSLAVILKRFGSWSNVLRELNIPIGRSRGLTEKQIVDHVKKVHEAFISKNGKDKVFSKEMYETFNFIDDVYISSKLIERRFETWLQAKKKLKIK